MPFRTPVAALEYYHFRRRPEVEKIDKPGIACNIPCMAREVDKLIAAARQLVEIQTQLGGGFLPARRNPLPPRKAKAQAEGPPELSPREKAAALKQFQDELQCTRCRLCESRRTIVFGEGNPDAKLVFVGEGPGEEEDRQGRPFVGRAGQKLNEMIAAMGLKRQDVYIANVVKCRPPGNRAPQPDEAAACGQYLLRQLQIIRPKVIVTLGNPSTQYLLKTTIGITKIRGNWHKLPPLAPGLAGIAVMPTFHPAYLLRNYTPRTRKEVWDDLQKVMPALGLKPKRMGK